MPNSSSNKGVLVSESIYNALSSDTVGLKIGCMTTVSHISPLPSAQTTEFIYLNPKIANKLMVPSDFYRPYYVKNDLIWLGPSVGILTFSKNQKGAIPRGKKGRLFKEIIEYGKSKGLFVFLFYPEGVNYRKRTINGYSLDNRGKWISGTYSFPSIIYNRIQYRSLENKTISKALLANLAEDPEIYLFNTRFLNKWEVNEALSGFELGKRFIPETRRYSRENLRELLTRFSEIFLKPTNSSRGQGIIKVISNSNGSFSYAKADYGELKWRTCYTLYTLAEALKAIGVTEKRYLIQQGIDLARFNGRVFDLRTQVQKDGYGEWVLTGVGVRVAGRNKFVTHIPNGGSAASFDEVIKKTFGSTLVTRSLINSQLKTICSVIPPRLEEVLGINLAILSLDIGIDQKGNLWILEVNSKPASFDEDEIRHRHLNLITDYFIFAAQKNAKRND